jgi:hypothetical protein
MRHYINNFAFTTSSTVAAALLYLAMILAAPPAAAIEGHCVMYCDTDAGPSEPRDVEYDENSAPARLGRAIHNTVVGTINGLLSGLGAILQPPKARNNAFFGTGGTSSSQPDVDLTPTASSPTSYASVGAQAYAAQDGSGCVFDGRHCPGSGVEINYRIGVIGGIKFKYPKIYKEDWAKLSLDDQRAVTELTQQRYRAEIDLPKAQRAYADATASAAAPAELSKLQKKIDSDRKIIDDSNKQIRKKFVDQTVLE